MTFLKSLLLWLDQGGNVFLGGSPDETISARAHRRQWWFRHVINLLFWDSNHCKDSYWAEMNKEHLPDEYRKTNTATIGDE